MAVEKYIPTPIRFCFLRQLWLVDLKESQRDALQDHLHRSITSDRSTGMQIYENSSMFLDSKLEEINRLRIICDEDGHTS